LKFTGKCRKLKNEIYWIVEKIDFRNLLENVINRKMKFTGKCRIKKFNGK
jgi:hypothetical protein